MDDVKMDGAKPAPTWFWVSLALLVVATVIAILLLHDDRQDQIKFEKKSTYFQSEKPKDLLCVGLKLSNNPSPIMIFNFY